MAKPTISAQPVDLSYLRSRDGRPRIGSISLQLAPTEEETVKLAIEAIRERFVGRDRMIVEVMPLARAIFDRRGAPIVPARTLVEGIRAHLNMPASRSLIMDILVAAGFGRASNNRGMTLPGAPTTIALADPRDRAQRARKRPASANKRRR